MHALSGPPPALSEPQPRPGEEVFPVSWPGRYPLSGVTEANEDPEVERALGLVGHVLDGKWTLERLLGAGAMGAVYAGRHRNGARGAVKLLHPELARMSEIRERFLSEGYAANRVGHRGAVRVLDDDVVKEGADEGTAYLVMEMLEGEPLEDRIARGEKLREEEILVILDQVLETLEAAHENGVVHRDLKPANLFLARDEDVKEGAPFPWRVKVLDFGLARLDERRMSTRAGLAMGTPSYMAPEQAGGRVDEIDGRSDLFGLGATAFVLASGKTVHEAEGLLEMVARMATMPARKLREVAPDASPELAAILDRALELQREDRYPSAAAMRADVKTRLAALAAGTTTTVAAPAPVSTAATTSDAPHATAPLPTDPPRSRRSGLGLGTLAVFLLLGAAGLLVFAMRAGAGSATPSTSSPTTMPPGSAELTTAAAASSAPSAVPTELTDLDASASPTMELDAAAMALADLDAGDDPDAGDDEEEEEDEAEDGGPPGPLAIAPSAPGSPPHPVAAQHTVHKKPRRATPRPTRKPWQKKRRTPRKH